MSGFQIIVEKIINEKPFRTALVMDPATTLQRVGIQPTPEILSAFEGIDADTLQALAENFNESNAAR